jgi:hypothetical protein
MDNIPSLFKKKEKNKQQKTKQKKLIFMPSQLIDRTRLLHIVPL